MKSYVKQYINTIENQKKLRKDQRMKKLFLMMALLASSAIAVIIVFISIKGIAPFLPNYTYGSVDFLPFITGMTWGQGIYGVGFIIVNTLISAFGAMLLSFPISVLTALYIAKIAPKRIAVLLSSVIELLASIPSVVYGVFASGTITLLVSSLAANFGFVTAGGSSLLAGVLLFYYWQL